MTAPQPGRDGVCECECGHPFARHVGYVGVQTDCCAGGTPGFCGCPVYRPAAPSEPPAVPDLMGNLRRSLERVKPPAGLRNINRCTPCLEGDHRRCTGSAGNVGCGCIHAAPVPVPLPPDPPVPGAVRCWDDEPGCDCGGRHPEPPAEVQQESPK